jgi:putative ABC transport system permease protein
MFVLGLAARSLGNRRLISALTVLSIALSVTLLVGIEHVRTGVREGFRGTIRGTDLIVGARGGTAQVLLSTVFGMSTPSGAIRWSAYARWRAHPAIAWTIPYSLGDSHRGFRVIGTTDAFYERYRFRDRQVEFAAGRAPASAREVAIGSDVAERLGYAVGGSVTLAHGVAGVSFAQHDSYPFTVTGVIASTRTPIDRALYVTLEGLEAMHAAEASGGGLALGPPASGRDAGEPSPITAFLVGTKNRIETPRLQHEMNQDRDEPLTAIIPGIALAQLWQTIGNAEAGLRVVATMTLVVGLIGMCVALYASLESRRREMSILRAVGAGPRTIIGLLVLESGLLALAGAVVGVIFVYAGIALGQGPVEARFGLELTARPLGRVEWGYLALVLSAGTLTGVLPAWKAYRASLADGLSPKL